jgi:hypothetical protein
LSDAKDNNIEEQVLEAVISKLLQTVSDKFGAALAISRDKDAEKEVTEAVMNENSMDSLKHLLSLI